MVVVKRETGRISGKQSIVEDPANNHFYLVGSIQNDVVDKTYIVKCNEKGKVKDWNEVYSRMPAQHEEVLDALETGVITDKDFNFVY